MNPAPRILIIDDEPQIRRLLRVTLESAQWQVFEADCATRGLSEAAFLKPDCIIMDLGLPDLDGQQLLKRLREWSQTPVLILSVRDEPGEKVVALESGADDFVTKPFDGSELLARCRAIMRRREVREETPLFQSGTLRMDFVARTVNIGTEPVELTATEYALLRLLALHAGKVMTHAQILRQIWGPNAEEHRQYLRVYIAALRKKLGTALQIKTESGIGYRLLQSV